MVKFTTVGLYIDTKCRLDKFALMHSVPRTASYDVILNYMLDELDVPEYSCVKDDLGVVDE